MEKLREVFEETDLIFLEADEKDTIGILQFNFVQGDIENKNGRTYSSKILKREIEKMKKRLEDSGISGMLGHDMSGNIKLDKISHIITNVEFEDETKIGSATAKILRTQKGRDLKVLLRNVSNMGASLVGFGGTDEKGNVRDDFQLSHVDLVVNPSFGDTVKVDSSNLIESGNNTIAEALGEVPLEKLIPQFQMAKSAGFTGNMEDYKNFLTESRKRTKEQYQKYSQALSAGFLGSYEDFQEKFNLGGE